MDPIEDTKLQVLHQHYEDSCSGLQRAIAQRERFFLLVLAALVIALYDLSAPAELGRVVAETLGEKAGFREVPDLRYLSSLVWFLVLGLVLRYCQAVIHIERHYKYVHSLEELLAQRFEHPAFTREGRSYTSHYPRFSRWARALYTIAFPAALASVLLVRLLVLVPLARSGLGLLFDAVVAAATLVTVALYLTAIHWPGKKPPPAQPGT